MNLAILVGVIASDIRRTEVNNGSVTKLRLKTVQKFRQDGEIKERSQTHLIDVWNSYLQKDVTPYLKKGQMIEVQGSIESRNIAKSGEPDRWTTTIVLRNTGVINVFGGPGSNMSVHSEAAGEAPLSIDHSGGSTAAQERESEKDDDVPF